MASGGVVVALWAAAAAGPGLRNPGRHHTRCRALRRLPARSAHSPTSRHVLTTLRAAMTAPACAVGPCESMVGSSNFRGRLRAPQLPQPRFLHATQAATTSSLSLCSGKRWRRRTRELRQPKSTWVLDGSSNTRNAISPKRPFFGAWEWVRFKALIKTRALVTSAGHESQWLLRYASAKVDGAKQEFDPSPRPLHAQPLDSSSLLLSPPLPLSPLCLQACGLQAGGRVGSARRGPASAASAGGSSGSAVPPSSATHRTRATGTQRCVLVCLRAAAAAGATPRTPTRAWGPLPLVAAHPPAASNPLGRAAAMTGRVHAVLMPVRKGHRRGVTVCALALQQQ